MQELLELGEAVGTQSRGLSKELISLLPISKYKRGFFSRKKSRDERYIFEFGFLSFNFIAKALVVYHLFAQLLQPHGLSTEFFNKKCYNCINGHVFSDSLLISNVLVC